MEFGVLGTVVVWHEGREIAISSAHQRTVLATLLLHHNQVVPVEKLIDVLWERTPPQTARNIVQGCVKHLRTLLSADPEVRILHRLPGYVLETPPERIDLTAFRRLATDSERLRESLTLWRNDPLADVPGLRAQRDALTEERLAALERCLDREIACQRHCEAIPELTVLVRAHPLREGLYGLLMRALHQAGRAGEALQAFHDARRVLREQTGSDPGPELRAVFERVLRAEDRPTMVLPRQLPAALPGFVDRAADLGTGPVTVISGQPGIGKTALALHWSHAQDFPDGQLFADLTHRSTSEALRGLVSALTNSPLPTDLNALTGLYRSLLAGKRMLIVLDNARDAAQVTPLLPGDGTCRVLVTCRNRLPGLVVSHQARQVWLDPMTDRESHAVLAARLGPERLAREPGATRRIIRWCAGSPLALARVASQVRDHLPLAVTELDDPDLDPEPGTWEPGTRVLRTGAVKTTRRSTPDPVAPASSTARVPA